MDSLIYRERISRCIEREHVGRFGREIVGIQDGGRIFSKYKERIWKRR